MHSKPHQVVRNSHLTRHYPNCHWQQLRTVFFFFTFFSCPFSWYYISAICFSFKPQLSASMAFLTRTSCHCNVLHGRAVTIVTFLRSHNCLRSLAKKKETTPMAAMRVEAGDWVRVGDFQGETQVNLSNFHNYSLGFFRTSHQFLWFLGCWLRITMSTMVMSDDPLFPWIKWVLLSFLIIKFLDFVFLSNLYEWVSFKYMKWSHVAFSPGRECSGLLLIYEQTLRSTQDITRIILVISKFGRNI